MNPIIRFCYFKEVWRSDRVSDLFMNFSGIALEKYCTEDGEYRFISIGNYTIDGKYKDNGQRIALDPKFSSKVLNQNDLVMLLNDKTDGSIIGTTILIDDKKYIYNQRSEKMVCKKNIEPLFAYVLLNSRPVKEIIKRIMQGGIQKYINFGEFKKQVVYYPELEEQQMIGNFFQTIDEYIELKTTEVQLKKAYQQKVLNDLFPQLGSTEPELRFKGFAERESWSESKVSAVFDYKKGLKGMKGNDFFGVGNAKYISFRNIYYKKCQYEELEDVYITDKSQQNKVEKFDILMTMSSETIGDISKTCMWMFDHDDVYVNSFSIILRLKDPRYDKYYWNYLLQTKSIRKKLMFEGQGITRINTSFKRVGEILVPVAPVAEQAEIGLLLQLLEEEVKLVEQELLLYQKLRKYYLNNMFV